MSTVQVILACSGCLLGILSTESYDKMDPVGVDPRWEAFKPFHEYLEKAFPLMYV